MDCVFSFVFDFLQHVVKVYLMFIQQLAWKLLTVESGDDDGNDNDDNDDRVCS